MSKAGRAGGRHDRRQTGLSAQQLAQAPPLPNVQYRVAKAESTPFPDEHFDLITVAQAVHWFDLPAYHAEVRRVALFLSVGLFGLAVDAAVFSCLFDTGLSLAEAVRITKEAGAAEVLTCVFARKPWPKPRAPEPDFVGWEAPNRFLVGYGLDHAGGMRGLPDICALD